MSKKKLGALIGIGAVALVIITVLITVLVMKGCNSQNNPTGDKETNIETGTDANGNTIADSGNTDGGKETEGATNSSENKGENTDNSSNSGSQGSSDISNGVTAQFTPSNSWESGGKSFVQYALVVNNNSGSDVGSWSIKIPIVSGLTVDNKWCCATETSGEYLVIKPESYNAAISKGGSISNIGIVIRTDSAHTITTYVMEADGNSSTGNNNIADNNSGNNGSSSGNSSSGNNSSGGSSSGDSGSSSGNTDYKPATPPEAYGGLHVVGTKLVDAKGNEIQLKGPSTHGLQWFPQYVDKECFKTFRD
ncbi:MAG: cellulose binding domain-containing protein, partial [Lachnospira sp.]|nr:cellulose binding domain-containing protein [Lachnospira sp.]